MVNRPNRAFTPTGSAATCAGVGCDGAVGTTTASTSCHVLAASTRRWASRSRSAASRDAEKRPAARMMAPTTGSTSSGCVSTKAPTRSAARRRGLRRRGGRRPRGRCPGRPSARRPRPPRGRARRRRRRPRSRTTAPPPTGRAPPAGAPVARSTGAGLASGVGGVGARGRLHHPRRQGDVAGQRTDGVEAGRERPDAGGRNPSPGGLQPDDAAARGRDPYRSAGVGAQRDVDQQYVLVTEAGQHHHSPVDAALGTDTAGSGRVPAASAASSG